MDAVVTVATFYYRITDQSYSIKAAQFCQLHCYLSRITPMGMYLFDGSTACPIARQDYCIWQNIIHNKQKWIWELTKAQGFTKAKFNPLVYGARILWKKCSHTIVMSYWWFYSHGINYVEWSVIMFIVVCYMCHLNVMKMLIHSYVSSKQFGT